MNGLTTPDAGWEAASRATGRNAGLGRVIARAVDAAAPHIVAAELRRLAGVFITAESRDEAAVLLGRADELDGKGGPAREPLTYAQACAVVVKDQRERNRSDLSIPEALRAARNVPPYALTDPRMRQAYELIWATTRPESGQR